jgi:hypothetical protein
MNNELRKHKTRAQFIIFLYIYHAIGLKALIYTINVLDIIDNIRGMYYNIN